MGRKRTVRDKMPLEWKTDTVSTTDATVVNGELDLDLLPDEIAEILLIDSTIDFFNIPDAANDDLDAVMMMSMDPDADDDPSVNANLEDLEVFYHHRYAVQQEIGAAGQSVIRNSDNKQLKPPEGHPILVGTNISQVVQGDATIAVDFITTIYFKRRKATALELNQILLKRR